MHRDLGFSSPSACWAGGARSGTRSGEAQRGAQHTAWGGGSVAFSPCLPTPGLLAPAAHTDPLRTSHTRLPGPPCLSACLTPASLGLLPPTVLASKRLVRRSLPGNPGEDKARSSHFVSQRLPVTSVLLLLSPGTRVTRSPQAGGGTEGGQISQIQKREKQILAATGLYAHCWCGAEG